MCGYNPPPPPPLPQPEPPDSAIEDTADKVVISSARKGSTKKSKTLNSQLGRRRLGTRSLQIPLNPSIQYGNLNYPT